MGNSCYCCGDYWVSHFQDVVVLYLLLSCCYLSLIAKIKMNCKLAFKCITLLQIENLLYANVSPKLLHLNKACMQLNYSSVILHVSLASTLLYSVALLNCFVAEEEGEPQGLPFCEMCCGFDDQLGGPVGMPCGLQANRLALLFSHLMAFASAVFWSLLAFVAGWPLL